MSELVLVGSELVLVGPVVQTVYGSGDGAAGHHVREIALPDGSRTALDREHACVEHLVSNCVECGRTPREHDDAEARAAAGYGPAVGHPFTARPECGCGLERGEELP